jgi:hypothetical protein
MKNIIISSLLASMLFVAPAMANEINGNNECNQAIPGGNCIKGRSFVPDPQLPPVVVVPQPNPPPVVVLPPDRYHHNDWRRRHGGVYFNFQTEPYNDSYDDPYYDDGSNYYADPYPRARVSKCSAIAKSLRRSGFRQVRSLKCSGRNYIYTASRDGDRLRLTVSGSSGRILNIRRVY